MKHTVELSREEIILAGKYGTARTNENKNRSDIADYDTNRFNLTSLQANVVGVAAEMGVIKWLGLPDEVLQNDMPGIWAGYVPSEDYARYLGQPDILGVIEVRRAHRKQNSIPIRTKDVRCNAIIVHAYVDIEYKPNGKIGVNPEVQLLGWADAVADWQTGTVAGYSNGNTREALEKKPMASLELEDIMRKAGVEQ